MTLSERALLRAPRAVSATMLTVINDIRLYQVYADWASATPPRAHDTRLRVHAANVDQ
jgi:hypothetical protein